MATTVSCVPSMEISWPVKTRRKSRLSRSGVVSTRIRPGMRATLRAWSGRLGVLSAQVAHRDVPGGGPVTGAQERVASAVAEDDRTAEEGAVGTEQEFGQRRDLLGAAGTAEGDRQ